MKRLLVASFMVVALSGAGFGDEGMSPPKGKISPHGADADCTICHVASRADLESWFTFPSTKRKFKADYNALCQQCHGIEFGHGAGKKPRINRDGLRLDADGKIACAITCHNMHIKSDDATQNKYHLRTLRENLCFSCHDK
ncbi:cytochrome c3 family protein [Geobacter sp. AOG1]|uniref:cytochrome c3 family protein n=1 Tax=Geobacter sp. AOG1 TaxID=1566346 RepID=UPI001CC4A2C2|nr:cytochrome c3 family protein [Geobacter sp. AOG1]GFE58759.1 cytochrome c [Geobacter sp. AOG1]